MTRKDYIALAAAMSRSRPTADDKQHTTNFHAERGRRMQWEHDCSLLADALHLDNPHFDSERFMIACGYFA